MLSDGTLEQSISEFKDEFRSGLSSLKRELAQEHETVLRSSRQLLPVLKKIKKKGDEKQFLLNS